VFVDIAIDVTHAARCIEATFPAGARLALVGTIQFGAGLQALRAALLPRHPQLLVPQARPLSPGELLGCTAPRLAEANAAVDAIV
jgi:2-(3-amino-3-carboxypropyl)histidine synthase